MAARRYDSDGGVERGSNTVLGPDVGLSLPGLSSLPFLPEGRWRLRAQWLHARTDAQPDATGALRRGAAVDGDLSGRTVGVLGLTFKPNTDDMRDAPSLDILPALQAMGARVQAFDPEGEAEARHLLPGVDFRPDAYAAAEGADVLVIITEWDPFRALDLERVKTLMRTPVLVDLRNIYKPADVRALGFRYASVGRA
jgi:hypothetical protein